MVNCGPCAVPMKSRRVSASCVTWTGRAPRAFPLEEMLSLNMLERMFFQASWEIEVEEVEKAFGK